MAWWTTKREGFSILVWTLSTRGSDPVSRDRQDSDASEANKDNPRRKSFFSAVTLSPLSGANLTLRFASCLIPPSAILQIFFLRLLASSKKMRAYTQILVVVLTMISTVTAHIKILYPALRGPNVAANQVYFCGGYNNTGTRVPFPLSNGFVLYGTSHPEWTIGIQISTAQDPSSFADFHTANGSDQLVVPYNKGEGSQACFPVNIAALGLPGVGDGSNVTLQFVQDATDGQLFQCMDLTLSSTFTIPSNVSCTNITTVANSTTSSSQRPTSTSQSGGALGSAQVSGLLGLSALGFLFSNLA